MNIVPKLILGALLATPLAAPAQYQLQFTFRGTSYETNEVGKVVSRMVTERTLLRDVAAAGNLDPSNWIMAYHIGGNELGDTVEILDAKTGAVLDTFFGLYFGEALGRVALKGGTQEKRIDYIYTKQNSHSMGASFTSKQQVSYGKGVTRTRIDGRAQWCVTREANRGVRIYSGNFVTGRVLTFGK